MHKLASYIESREVSPDFLRVFRLILGGLALLHSVRLAVMNFPFYVFDENVVALPILGVLTYVPKVVHAALFLLMIPASVAVLLGKMLRASFLFLSGMLLYSIFASYFAYHQDTFLAVLIFFFASFIYNSRDDKILASYAIFALQAVMVILYLTAGSNKVSSDYLGGHVIAAIFRSSFIYKNLIGQSILANDELMLTVGRLACYFSAFVELSVPVLILFKRTRVIAVCLGLGLHAGIGSTTRGVMFNFYVPSLYLLWFTALQLPATLSAKDLLSRSALRLENLERTAILLLSAPLVALFAMNWLLITWSFLRKSGLA